MMGFTYNPGDGCWACQLEEMVQMLHSYPGSPELTDELATFCVDLLVQVYPRMVASDSLRWEDWIYENRKWRAATDKDYLAEPPFGFIRKI